MIKVMITMMTMKKMKMVKVRMIKMKIDGQGEDVPLAHLALGLSCEPSVGVEHPRVRLTTAPSTSTSTSTSKSRPFFN